MALEEDAVELGFGEAFFEAIDFDEDVAFFEAGAFGGGVVVVLADVGGSEAEVVAFDGFELHAATNPGTHGPGADAAGDVGLESPVFGQDERDGLDGAVAFDGEGEGVFIFKVVEGPGEVGGGNERGFVGGDDFVAWFEAGFGGGGIGEDFGNGGALVIGEGEADRFGRGHGMAEVEGDALALIVVG